MPTAFDLIEAGYDKTAESCTRTEIKARGWTEQQIQRLLSPAAVRVAKRRGYWHYLYDVRAVLAAEALPDFRRKEEG